MADPCVYLAALPSGACKIGFSTKPEKRVAALGRAGHFDLVLVRTWAHRHARILETAALRATKSHRVAGEWINLPAPDAALIIDRLYSCLKTGELPLPAPRGPRIDRATQGWPGSIAYVASEAKRVEAGIALIADDWAKSEIRTGVLTKRANVCYAVIKRHLGARPQLVPYRGK